MRLACLLLMLTLPCRGDFSISGAAVLSGASFLNGNGQYIAPPVASFAVNTNQGVATLTVNFTDTSTQTPTSWAWTFGDGGTSTSQNPSHDYTAPGTYTATLIAANAGGGSQASTSIVVNITAHMIVDFEAGSDGDGLTTNLLNTGTQTILPGSWTVKSNDAVVVTLPSSESTSGQMTRPERIYYNGAFQTDGGTRGAALSMATKNSIYYTFTIPVAKASFGFYYLNNLTNIPDNGAQWDLVVLNDATGNNQAVFQYFNGGGSQNPYYRAHTVSNSTTYVGTQISATTGASNWITCLVDFTNRLFTLSVYDGQGVTQIGANSTCGIANTNLASFSVLAYGHSTFQARTNFIDNLLVNTNGVFPLLPP